MDDEALNSLKQLAARADKTVEREVRLDYSKADETREDEVAIRDLAGIDPFDYENFIGTTVGGRFRIESFLGRGGMGMVYKGTQTNLNRPVVIKILAQSLKDDQEACMRFEREAVGLSRLQHANIVTVYDFGHEGKLTYIVMEYVDGQTLADHILANGPIRQPLFGKVAIQILDAMAEAHAQGIIHRDLKPSNIMLTQGKGQREVIKLLDFGLAKLTTGDHVEVTQKQSLIGSVGFLAPEQILGHEFDQRVDVYALGVLFYYMLSGRKPFQSSDDFSTLYQHIHEEPPPLHELMQDGTHVPQSVLSLVHQCLAKDPNDRCENARQLYQLFQGCMPDETQVRRWSHDSTGGETGMAATGGDTSNPGAKVDAVDVSSNRLLTSPSGAHTGNLAKRFQMPPSTGQHPRVGGRDSAFFAPATPPLNLESVGAPSAQASVVTESFNKVSGRQSNGTKKLLATVLVLLLVVGAAYAVHNNLIPMGSSQASSLLGEVESLVATKQWAQANTLLQAAKADVGSDPEQVRRVANLATRIDNGLMLSQGTQFERSKNLDKARDVYLKLLSRAPGDPEATAALKAVNIAIEKRDRMQSPGEVKVTSTTVARVMVDGSYRGVTPITLELEPQAYVIELLAADHKPWRKTIRVEGGAEQMIEAALERKPKRPRVRRAKPKKFQPPANDSKPQAADAEKSP